MTYIEKIIYFDKETINNLLELNDNGNFSQQISKISNKELSGDINVDITTSMKLSVPFVSRLKFLFSGEIDAKYIHINESVTTISSTDISRFNAIKKRFTEFKNVNIKDIKNSSTSFKVAGWYSKMITNEINGMDMKEFLQVMDKYDGYDTYSINELEYIRFNSDSFISNYKRNDLLLTSMDIYCVKAGKFNKSDFDFLNKMANLQDLFNMNNSNKTLAELYEFQDSNKETDDGSTKENTITLYDAVYACISSEDDK